MLSCSFLLQGEKIPSIFCFFFLLFFSPKHPAGKQNYFSNAKGMVSISSAGLALAKRGIDRATRVGAPHLTHFCVHGCPACLCETNSLSSTSRAWSMLWRGGRGALYGIINTIGPYGEQKDLPLAFSAHKQCTILCVATVTLRLQFLA